MNRGLAGALIAFSRSTGACPTQRLNPGPSGTRINPLMGLSGSVTNRSLEISVVALTKCRLAEGKAAIICTVMARVMSLPVFCSIKGLLLAAKSPARRTASPIYEWPSI